MKKLFLTTFLALAGVSYLSAGHYVCYDNKVIIYYGDAGGDSYYLKYNGCMMSRYNCSSLGMKKFGYYPNDYETGEALRRCFESKPRFVD